MKENEIRFVNAIVNLEANVKKELAYVKENYDIDGVYDEESNTIKLECKNIDNALMLAQAKDYIEHNIDETLVRVIF